MGGSNRAQRAAEQSERARQSQIGAATRSIDQVFDSPSRKAQQDDFVSALREFFTEDANRQKQVADRGLKFSLARTGNTGGSLAADTGRNLNDEFTRGLLEAERRAQGSLADLRSQDEQSRLNLIQLAQSGLDTTTAANRAAGAIRSNIEAGKTGSRVQGLGDIFGATADIRKRQEEADAFRRAQLAPVGSQFAAPFSRGG